MAQLTQTLMSPKSILNNNRIKKNRVQIVSPDGDRGKDIVRHLNGSEGMVCAYSPKLDLGKWDFEENIIILLDMDLVDSLGQPSILSLPIVLFNVEQVSELEKNALLSGYKGVFFKHSSLNLVEKGLKSIFDGSLWFSRKILENLSLERSRAYRRDKNNTTALLQEEEEALGKLTAREEEILLLITSGVRNKQIAQDLNLSPHTVRGHIAGIFNKLRVNNRLQAMAWGTKYLEAMYSKILEVKD